MFWIIVALIVGIAIGVVIGDMLNAKSFRSLFILDEDNND